MKLMQYVKGRSSRRLQEEFPELRKRYWGQHLWRADTSARRWARWAKRRSRTNIENQKGDEDDQRFKMTAPTEP